MLSAVEAIKRLMICASVTASLGVFSPQSAAAQGSTGDIPAAAAERVENFARLLQREQVDEAFKVLIENHPRKDIWSQQVPQLSGAFKQMIAQRPIEEVELVSWNLFGSKIVRFNYIVDSGHTGVAMVIVMYRSGNDWVAETICVDDDLEDATAGGDGVLQCQTE